MKIEITNTSAAARVSVPVLGLSLGPSQTTRLKLTTAQFTDAQSALDAMVTAGAITYRVNKFTGTWNPGTISNQATAGVALTAPGTVVGEPVILGFGPPGGIPLAVYLSGEVRTAGSIIVKLLNMAGGDVTLGSGTITAVLVWED